METQMSTPGATTSRSMSKPRANSPGNSVRKILLGLARILALLVTFLLCLPVILLPLTTAAPVWVWILLAVADVTLMIVQFRFTLASRETLGVFGGILAVSLLAVAA